MNHDTLEEYFAFLAPGFRLGMGACPEWPPDVFALCAAILRDTGLYHLAVTDWPPRNKWSEWAARIGVLWRKNWCKGKKPPREVLQEWTKVSSHARLTSAELRNGKKTAAVRTGRALLNLLAISDQACENVGMPFRELDEEQRFYFHARVLLMSRGSGSSLCERIPHSRGRVLPKMHTGQSGLTVRSLSHHLAYCPPSEIIPKWRPIDTPLRDQHFLNLLLVPWPVEIRKEAFAPRLGAELSPRNMPGAFGYFGYDPPGGGAAKVARYVEHCLDACPNDRKPHGVILPELALAPAEYERVRDVVLERGAFLLCGVAAPGEGAPSINRLHLDIPMTLAPPDPVRFISLTQSKHHRWLLDRPQIDLYGLRDRLQRDRSWWEHCDFREREQNIACIRDWLAIAPLICEDLARPDPIQEIVRSIGPNLVVALLMDGPQLSTRWSRRYASVLSDDPGCSVLTLTSVGMIKLTEEKYPKTGPRVVALWQDRLTSPHEISLADDADAVLLRIAKTARPEWTADGRSDGDESFYAIIEDYARDVIQIRTGATPKAQATSSGGT